jgi:hypothetical protein
MPKAMTANACWKRQGPLASKQGLYRLTSLMPEKAPGNGCFFFALVLIFRQLLVGIFAAIAEKLIENRKCLIWQEKSVDGQSIDFQINKVCTIFRVSRQIFS